MRIIATSVKIFLGITIFGALVDFGGSLWNDSRHSYTSSLLAVCTLAGSALRMQWSDLFADPDSMIMSDGNGGSGSSSGSASTTGSSEQSSGSSSSGTKSGSSGRPSTLGFSVNGQGNGDEDPPEKPVSYECGGICKESSVVDCGALEEEEGNTRSSKEDALVTGRNKERLKSSDQIATQRRDSSLTKSIATDFLNKPKISFPFTPIGKFSDSPSGQAWTPQSCSDSYFGCNTPVLAKPESKAVPSSRSAQVLPPLVCGPLDGRSSFASLRSKTPEDSSVTPVDAEEDSIPELSEEPYGCISLLEFPPSAEEMELFGNQLSTQTLNMEALFGMTVVEATDAVAAELIAIGFHQEEEFVIVQAVQDDQQEMVVFIPLDQHAEIMPSEHEYVVLPKYRLPKTGINIYSRKLK